MPFFSCSSDDGVAVRRVSFKADGVLNIYEDIKVTKTVDNSWEVPITRLDISAEPIGGTPGTLGLRIIRGGDYDGQATNGGGYFNGNGYHFNFDHPIQTHLTINTAKRMKGTFEGILTNFNGENVQLTEGKIDITYYPDNPQYIKSKSKL